jgi:NADH dehydrogenase
MACHSAQSLEQSPLQFVPSGTANGPRPHVVIVGAGFAGLTVAKRLAKAQVDITLIDRENHHLFQPLLYQVATAGLSPADIAWPIRSLVRRQHNTRVLLGAVTGVDLECKHVVMDGRNIAYDILVLATGASHGYFGRDSWAAHAPGLKTVDDATEIRRRLLLAFERAEMESDARERERLLTIVIVGGGPTGVEMAGAVVELAHTALADDFCAIDPQQTRVLLVEAGPRLLPNFPESLSRHAEQALRHLGVDVRLNQAVTHCAAIGVTLGDESVDAATVIWAAGVTASPAAAWLAVADDRSGRVLVGPDLRPPGMDDVFVIGDTALAHDVAGKPLPGIAPVAKQQGAYVAAAIQARPTAKGASPPFRYRDRGLLATVGRKTAVIAFGRLRLKGWFAWWVWGIAHIYFLVSLRNRLIVMTQWLWSYVSFERGARLITGLRTTLDPDRLGRLARPGAGSRHQPLDADHTGAASTTKRDAELLHTHAVNDDRAARS